MSKGELKKEQLLEAGLEVMKAQGYNGTSVNDIVKAAGIPKGSFYNYFESKEDFALDAIEQAANEGYQASEKVLRNPGLSPIQRLQQFFELETQGCGEMDYKVGCFLGNMCQEMADGNEAIRAKVNTLLNRQALLIQSVLEEAQAQGGLSSEEDTNSLAEFLFNSWEGALLRMKATKSCAPLDAFKRQLPRLLNA